MTNVEFSESLTKLAEFYANTAAEQEKPILRIYVYTKADLVKWLHLIGGMFTKDTSSWSDTLIFMSKRIPEFGISIPRDKVCKKIVTWECEPALSPDDTKDIDAQFIQAEPTESAEV